MKETKKQTATTKLIDALFKHEISDEKPSSEWFTVWDIAKNYSLSRGHATKKIASYVRNGIMEMKRFRVDTDGARRVVPHYRLK